MSVTCGGGAWVGHVLRVGDLEQCGDARSAYLLTERPLEQSVTLSPHDDEEQRKVRSSSRSITVQVQPQTHFVSIFTGVKCCEDEKQTTEA